METTLSNSVVAFENGMNTVKPITTVQNGMETTVYKQTLPKVRKFKEFDNDKEIIRLTFEAKKDGSFRSFPHKAEIVKKSQNQIDVRLWNVSEEELYNKWVKHHPLKTELVEGSYLHRIAEIENEEAKRIHTEYEKYSGKYTDLARAKREALKAKRKGVALFVFDKKEEAKEIKAAIAARSKPKSAK